MKFKFAIVESDGLVGYVTAADKTEALEIAEQRWNLTDSVKVIKVIAG